VYVQDERKVNRTFVSNVFVVGWARRKFVDLYFPICKNVGQTCGVQLSVLFAGGCRAREVDVVAGSDGGVRCEGGRQVGRREHGVHGRQVGEVARANSCEKGRVIS
jgi:hypothetical protein